MEPNPISNFTALEQNMMSYTGNSLSINKFQTNTMITRKIEIKTLLYPYLIKKLFLYIRTNEMFKTVKIIEELS